jgi:iron complex outermembrane receptor protein
MKTCIQVKRVAFVVATVILAACAHPVAAFAAPLPADSIESMTLEELMNIPVYSVSRKLQRIQDSAAAVFVITGEDIRRSGATSIPEALRMAPGIDVARIDANKWAITSRGFNSQFANKLLVLIDGRSVYTPLFSGVFWDVQDTLLEDVDRIEVIRGPGAALWGANAVNGVINILTKTAKQSQGGLLTAGAGNVEKGFGGARVGGNHGDALFYKAYAKYFNRDGGMDARGNEGSDQWNLLHGGFRVEWEPSERGQFNVQGDIYGGKVGQVLTALDLSSPSFTRTFDERSDVSGGNVLGRWTRKLTNGSEFRLQAYYDRTGRQIVETRQSQDIYDVDFQHQFRMGERQEIIWGLGGRMSRDRIEGGTMVAFDPVHTHEHMFSGFVQDEIDLLPQRVRLTLGTKVEYNQHSDFEFQPNARLIWTPNPHHSLWAAVSRAVRTSSRADRDISLDSVVLPAGAPGNPFPAPLLVTLNGNPKFESEKLIAYEMGYRVRPTDRLTLDGTLFFNDYEKLRTSTPGTPFLNPLPFPHFVLPQTISNEADGVTFGGELAVDWRPIDTWRLQATYTYLRIQLHNKTGNDPTAESDEKRSPQQQVSFRSSVDLRKDLELDLAVRYVDPLPDFHVSGYVALDARLGWKLLPGLEIAVAAQNLFDKRHPEFAPEGFLLIHTTESPRSVYGKITWTY